MFRAAPVLPTISFEHFAAIDLRVGTVMSVEDVAESDKLVALQVDFGDHQRCILVGMKQEREDPTEVAGKQALFLVNLAPRELFGRTSEGMLVDIGHADGLDPKLLLPEALLPNGARAG